VTTASPQRDLCPDHGSQRRHSALLAGHRVAEVGASSAVRAAGRILAQMGAEVFIIRERSDGEDPYLDAGKPVRAWRWRQASAPRLAAEVRDCDVVLDDFRPDHPSAARRATVDAVAKRRADLVVTTITPYGITGPHRGDAGSDAVLAAVSGLANLTPRDVQRVGDGRGQPPLHMPGRLVSNYGGVAATTATLAALWHRRRTGEGQHIDVSLLETLIPTIRRELALAACEGVVASRFMRVWRLAPWGVKPCADGYVFVQIVEEHHWRALVDLMGSPNWATDPALFDAGVRFDRRKEIERLMLPWLARQTKNEIAELAQQRGLPFAPVSLPEDLPRLPQVAHRAFVGGEGGHPELGLPYLIRRGELRGHKTA